MKTACIIISNHYTVPKGSLLTTKKTLKGVRHTRGPQNIGRTIFCFPYFNVRVHTFTSRCHCNIAPRASSSSLEYRKFSESYEKDLGKLKPPAEHHLTIISRLGKQSQTSLTIMPKNLIKVIGTSLPNANVTSSRP